MTGEGGRQRKSRRKNSSSKPGEVIIKAHPADWGKVGEIKPRGSASYVSTWACTVCGKRKTNSSHVPNARPAAENHPALTK